jgi:hypothetical protein
MPLVMQRDGPYAIPQLVCDHCGEVIMAAHEGNLPVVRCLAGGGGDYTHVLHA